MRQVPHVKGNWASHVYIRPHLEADQLEMIETIKGAMSNMLPEKAIHMEESPHISLSRTFYLQQWQLERAQMRIGDILSRVDRPPISFHRLNHYQNDDQSRSFLALDCDSESSRWIVDVIRQVDGEIVRLGGERYYEEPRIHMSILWAVGTSLSTVSQLPSMEVHTLLVRHYDLCIKMGNRLVTVN